MILISILVIIMTVSTAISAPQLPPCPSSPNCVSSQASDSQYIEPFKITGNTNVAFEALRKILSDRPDTNLVSATEPLIVVEFKTTLGFVDDGLFSLDIDNKLIHVRSASRLGYWDIGKNRRRMEEIRSEFNKTERGHQ